MCFVVQLSPLQVWFTFKTLVEALGFFSLGFTTTPPLWCPLPKTKRGAVVVHENVTHHRHNRTHRRETITSSPPGVLCPSPPRPKAA